MPITKILLLCSLPIIGGVIGWFTNFVAVKMLFHPREPRKILFFTFQGVFPKRQREIASKLAKVVARELLGNDEIKERLADPKNIETITNTVEERLLEYLSTTFPEKYPWVNLLFGDYIRGDMKSELMHEIDTMAPVMIQRYVNSLDETMDVEKIVEEKVNNFSVDKLEALMMGILNRELKFIERIGAVIGFLVGVFQMILMLFT